MKLSLPGICKKLPLLRYICYLATFGFSLVGTAVCIITLNYQLVHTRGYNRPVPALLTAFLVTMLFSAMGFIRHPRDPQADTALNRFTSLFWELMGCLGCNFFLLASGIRMHAATPGLWTTCGNFFLCDALQAIEALGFVSWSLLALQFASLLFLGSYQRANNPYSHLFSMPFDAWDWHRGCELGGMPYKEGGSQRGTSLYSVQTSGPAAPHARNPSAAGGMPSTTGSQFSLATMAAEEDRRHRNASANESVHLPPAARPSTEQHVRHRKPSQDYGGAKFVVE